MNLEPIIQCEAKSEREKQISYINPIYMGSRKRVAQLVKNLPALQESCIRPPGLGRFPGGGHGITPAFVPGEFHR